MMRKELNENEIDQVVGGTVIIASKGYVGFDTTKEMFALQGVTWKECRDYVEELMDQNPTMGNAEFDQFCKEALQAKGWI